MIYYSIDRDNKMKKICIFGAGKIGKRMLALLPHDEVAFFIDNDVAKDGQVVEGIPIRCFDYVKNSLADYRVLIAVSEKYLPEIENQVSKYGISYQTFQEIDTEKRKEKLLQRPDYISVYRRAIGWIKHHNLKNQCMINSTTLPEEDPEVTGYYTPTLLQWGYRNLAASFGKWLCDIQNPDGSWFNALDRHPNVFSSSQILNGLMAIRKSMQETRLSFAYNEKVLDDHILHGIDWLFSNMHQDGRLTASFGDFQNDSRMCPETVYIYCLKPIIEAAEIYGRPKYREKAIKFLRYYLNNYRDKILHFNQFNLFYFYVMEALVDLGETDLVRNAMHYTAEL